MPTVTRRGRKRQSQASKSQSTKKQNRSIRKAVLDQICADLEVETAKNDGRKPHKVVSSIVEETKADCPWITRDIINYAFKTYLKKKEAAAMVEESKNLEVLDLDEDGSSIRPNKGGRPAGTTDRNKLKIEVATRLAMDDMAVEFDSKRKAAKRLNQRLKVGTLSGIIKKFKSKYKLDESVVINKGTIRARSYKKSLIVSGLGPVSPMAEVEPVLVDLIIKMSTIRRCLTPTQCLHLANDIIAGTKVEEKVIEFKKKIYKKNYESAKLGQNYWKGFLRRWGNVLTSKRGQKFALDRSNATTFTNINKMYDEVYEALVESGLATQLNESIYMDRIGNVATKHEAFGAKCTHTLDHPDMCLVVDEVGSNLSQKGDGHVGGQKFVCAKGTIPQVKVQHSERHFTLLGFTALSGEPVLCLIVISGVRQHLNIETGIDPSKPVTGNVRDKEFIDKNFGPGKLFPGGPICHFRGKDIPCLVRWSPKGSITSQILADALAHIDSYSVFRRDTGKVPFLLLDGHNSRFDIPFLEYITTEAHKWTVCIGVPYGTAIWQVADSKEQNGSYKIALARAKKELLDQKLSLHIDPPSLCSTDIIPLVNIAWEKSFARVAMNKNAIAERGWYPLNRNLLLYREIQDTMTSAERQSFNDLLLDNLPMSTVDVFDNSTSISALSNVSDHFNFQQQKQDVIALNYTSGNSAMVLDSYIGEKDLREARERNRLKKMEGQELKSKFEEVKTVSAMFHFNHLGCQIGMDALQKKREILKLQEENLLEQKKKELDQFNKRKVKYDMIIAKNIPDDKLTITQLKSLLAFKKRKTDTPFTSLPKNDLLQLWKEWKHRIMQQPFEESDLTQSVTIPTRAGDTTITVPETCDVTEV